MKIINIGILAHVDAGKTTLTESLLYASGAISEPGLSLIHISEPTRQAEILTSRILMSIMIIVDADINVHIECKHYNIALD